MAATSESHNILPLLLSLNAGYVDTAGFLAQQGLFTAHVTGNFVTLGASLALGTSGAVAKVLALPVFCVVVIATRLLGSLLSSRRRAAMETLLTTKVLLLIAGAALTLRFGPFHGGDNWRAVLTGMVLVAAMAVQNAVHRVHLGSVPPSTLMTGTTTQIMIDLADLIHANPATQTRSDSKLGLMSLNVLVFALGCGAAALLFLKFGVWCFVWPPLLGALALVLRLTGRNEESGAASKVSRVSKLGPRAGAMTAETPLPITQA
jgi:uncharacterized membrane protein YoaK (UPF0700 family)